MKRLAEMTAAERAAMRAAAESGQPMPARRGNGFSGADLKQLEEHAVVKASAAGDSARISVYAASYAAAFPVAARKWLNTRSGK